MKGLVHPKETPLRALVKPGLEPPPLLVSGDEKATPGRGYLSDMSTYLECRAAFEAVSRVAASTASASR